jgi:hypothetical protein
MDKPLKTPIGTYGPSGDPPGGQDPIYKQSDTASNGTTVRTYLFTPPILKVEEVQLGGITCLPGDFAIVNGAVVLDPGTPTPALGIECTALYYS